MPNIAKSNWFSRKSIVDKNIHNVIMTIIKTAIATW
jgi:hypothetical protein